VILALAPAGCVVLRSTLEAEVARRQSAEAGLGEEQARSAELDRERRDLAAQLARRELERESLGKERVDLLNEIEDLRIKAEGLEGELAKARGSLQERESAIGELQGSYRRLVEQLEGELEEGQIEIQRLRGRLQIRALEQILFDSGSAELKTEGREVLSKVASQLKAGTSGRILVEGHTDNVPISNERFASNWELSGARALRVVRLLIEQGVEPQRLSAIAVGEFRPIADNGTREGRARNRRIEIVLLPEGEE
jgi:chemotaxis protein MotB